MPNKGQNYDSSGPDIRVRGNAYQVLEKYLQLARDAGTAGDRVAAENFLQHADHYYRVVSSMSEGRRPQIGGRDISVADVNVHNVNQGLSAALSGHGHSNPGSDDGQDPQPGNSAGNNQGNGGGNGQNRPQQHQQQGGQRETHNSNSNGQDGDRPMASSESSGNTAEGGAPQNDEQPEYPDELLPADQQTSAPNGDGSQPDNRQQHNRMGRGRRRGPGRRVRAEGEGPGDGSSTPDSDGAQ
jgi:hypothetical protein